MKDVEATVRSQAEASQLQTDFEELVARVNGDMMAHSMSCDDPFSVEQAVLQAEQSIDYHLFLFAENANLQLLAADIKATFATSIRAQARAVYPPSDE